MIKNNFKKFIGHLKALGFVGDQIDVAAASQNIRKGINFRGFNVFILACAIIIASVGLNINSIPVIIGAMLISPLMGPILGLGLGLGTNDAELMKDAARNILVMVSISIISSALFFLISPLKLEQPSELLARTNPTVYDVFIALFGGIAGMFETARKEKGTVLPGVAIATAIMPPLCTVGYGIANLEWRYIAGALYLFLINGIFIALATFITVKYLHFPLVVSPDPVKQKKTSRIIGVVLTLLIVPSVFSASKIIRDNAFDANVKKLVNENKTLSKSYIYDYSTDVNAKPRTIKLFIAGEMLTVDQKEVLYNKAEAYGFTRSQISFHDEATIRREGELSESELIQSVLKSSDQKIAELNDSLSVLNAQLLEYRANALPARMIADEMRAQYPGIQDVILTRGDTVFASDSTVTGTVVAIVKCPEALLSDGDTAKIASWLKVRLTAQEVSVIRQDI